MCISVCMCISCVYLVCILRGVHIRLYLHVSACICMYLHVCLYRNTLLQPCFEGVHMCMYRCVSVCMCMYVYVSFKYPCSICMYCMQWPRTALKRSQRPQMTRSWGGSQQAPLRATQGRCPTTLLRRRGPTPGPVLAHPSALLASGGGKSSPWCPQ